MSEILTRFGSKYTESPLEQPLLLGNGDSIYNDLVLLPGQTYNLVLRVTEQQYINLLSASINGCQQTFPDDWIEILYPLIKAGKLDFCEQVAECILTSDEVYDALNNFNQVNQGFNTPEQNVVGQQTELINPTDCDPDEIWGNAVALWQAINQTTVDVLELISTATNVTELASKVISAIPILNQLPIDEMLALIADMGDWLLENYNSALTLSLEQQIQCELFCLMLEDCTFNYEQLLDHFSSYFEIDANAYQLVNLIGWLTGVVPAGEPFVRAMTVFQLYIVGIAESFLGIPTTNFYAIQSQLGEPDDDWQYLCDDCATFEQIVDFGTADGDTDLYTVDWGNNSTVYVSSVAHSGTLSMQIRVSVPSDRVLSKIVLQASRDSLGGGTKILRATTFLDSVQQEEVTVTWTGTSLQDYTINLDGASLVDEIVIYAQASNNTTAGSGAVSKATISGDGTNPWPPP